MKSKDQVLLENAYDQVMGENEVQPTPQETLEKARNQYELLVGKYYNILGELQDFFESPLFQTAYEIEQEDEEGDQFLPAGMEDFRDSH